MCTFPVVRKLYRDTIGPDRPVRSVAVRKIYRTFISTSFSLCISFMQANSQSISASTMCAIQSNSFMSSAPLACSGSPPRCFKHLPSYTESYLTYVRFRYYFSVTEVPRATKFRRIVQKACRYTLIAKTPFRLSVPKVRFLLATLTYYAWLVRRRVGYA